MGYEINQPRLEHLAIWSENIDDTTRFLQEALGWRRHPIVFGVDEDNGTYGGMELAFVDANGLWLEPVQPTTEGPGMEFLKELGNGSIVELDFVIDDFDKNLADFKSRGIDLIGMDGKPITDGGYLIEYVMVDGKREEGVERLSYLPFDLARGTSIELLWEDKTGVVIRRDNSWNEEEETPRTGPRLDHVTVLADDLDKMIPVYTDILNLSKIQSTVGVERPWLGLGGENHVWISASKDNFFIELVGSKSNGLHSTAAKNLGEGAILELGVEVNDIDAFFDQAKTKGFTLTAGDSSPLPAGEKAMTDDSTGDRYAYFDRQESYGMRIRLFQRGPASTSAFTLRDASV